MKLSLSKNNNKSSVSSVDLLLLKKSLEDMKNAKPLQNVVEYYDFVKSMQNLTSFPLKFSTTHMQMPFWRNEKTGAYIYIKLSTGQIRKVKLAIALCKEKSNFNLALYKVDDTNKIVRAKDSNGSFYVVLDREMVICAEVGLFREFNRTADPNGQGVNAIFLSVFPLNIEIARAILKSKGWKGPAVKFRGGFMDQSVGVDGDTMEPDINPVDPLNYDASKLNSSIVLSYVRMNADNTEKGTGSGIGVVKADLVREIVTDPKGASSDFASKPTTVFLETDIDNVSPTFYSIFQVSYLGNDQNMQIIKNDANGNLVYNNTIPIFFDLTPSGF